MSMSPVRTYLITVTQALISLLFVKSDNSYSPQGTTMLVRSTCGFDLRYRGGQRS